MLSHSFLSASHFDMSVYSFHIAICPPEVIYLLHIMFYTIIQFRVGNRILKTSTLDSKEKLSRSSASVPVKRSKVALGTLTFFPT